MKHLKIKVKLLLGFGLVSLLAIIVGLVGAVGLTSTDAKYKEVLELSSAGISSMADMRELFQLQRLALRSIIVDMQNPGQLQADIDSLREYEARMADAMSVYESTIIDPASEQNYYKAKDVYSNMYKTAKQGYIDAALRGDYDEAMAALAEGGKAADPIIEGLQGTVDYINDLITIQTADLSGHSATMVIIQVIVMLSAGVCSMVAGLYISSLISKPIITMSDFFVRFGSTGDLALSEADQKNIAAKINDRDETGLCIAAAAKMVTRLMEINEKLSLVANGDLSVSIQALSEKDSLGISVTSMVDSLGVIFSDLQRASGQVSTGAEQISQGAQQLASGSSQQAASIEEFSASLTGMLEKTRLNAENSTNAAKMNEKMGSMLEESVSSMDQMLEAMKGIDESSKNITRVIKVIDDIAFQTNILALNAAVEAARAGQHGKGFAVVADEVRNLASKSADAAKETASLIAGSSEKVKEGNQIVGKTSSSLEAVAESSKEVVRLIGQVSDASIEQTMVIKEIHQGIEQISSVVQENSASAEESAAAAEEMSAQAEALDEIVARFKLRQQSGALKSSNTDMRHSSSGISLSRKKIPTDYNEKYS